MHIYQDESGNAGSLSRPSATRHFALVALVIEDRDSVERAMRELRKELSFGYEFKSHKTPIDIRIALLKRAISLDLYFDVMVVDKEALTAGWQQRSGLDLYRAMSQQLLAVVVRDLKNAILVTDEVDRRQTEALRKAIRQKVNPSRSDRLRPRRIKKVSGHDSRRDDLLQLADVVVGSVFRARERGDRRSLDVIESRIRWHKFSGEK